jgi:hypothetical protein
MTMTIEIADAGSAEIHCLVQQASSLDGPPGAKYPIEAGTPVIVLWSPEHSCWYTPDRAD